MDIDFKKIENAFCGEAQSWSLIGKSTDRLKINSLKKISGSLDFLDAPDYALINLNENKIKLFYMFYLANYIKNIEFYIFLSTPEASSVNPNTLYCIKLYKMFLQLFKKTFKKSDPGFYFFKKGKLLWYLPENIEFEELEKTIKAQV